MASDATPGKECLLCAADVRSGDPATEIATAAIALNADLIVMTTHHFVDSVKVPTPTPSVAEAVLRRTGCPVLLLPVSTDTRNR